MENKKVSIKDVVKLLNGYAFKPTDRDDSGLKIIRIQNLNNPLANYNKTKKIVDKKYIIKEGDTLISWSGSLGVYIWEGEDAYLNQHIYKVQFISNDISKDYFKYVIEVALKELSYKMKGVGLMHLTKKDLDNYEFYLPPIEIQNKIILQLKNIESLIVLRNKSLLLLDEYLKSIFFEFFGDPIVNPKKINTVSLSDEMFKISTGTTPSRKNTSYFDGNVPWVKSTDVRNNFIFETSEYISDEAKEKTGLKIYPKNSILLAMYGQGKTRGRVSILGIEATCNQACAVIRSNYMSHIFLYSVLNYSYEYLRNFSKGGNQNNLSLSILKTIKILNPSLKKQNEFSEVFFKIQKLKQRQEKSLNLFKELFHSLLYNHFYNDQNIDDEIDITINDDLQIESILEDFKVLDFESLTFYNSTKDLLFKILERTEEKNKNDELNKFKKGIIQKFDKDNLKLLTNKEFKNEINPS